MATKVFISWGGDLSRKLAEALRNWLPASLQFVKPYFSPEDIEKGAKWNSEIAKELESSDIGIICLTQDNVEKPWILFEAGALSKSLDKARVCTVLFNLDAADVKGPLTSFQATKFLREDFKRLVNTINSSSGDSKLDSVVIENVFDIWWPRLEGEVSKIIQTHGKGRKTERRSERDILEEILELTRVNAERAHKSYTYSRVSRGTIMRLVEDLDELWPSIVAFEHGDRAVSLLRRLDRSLQNLCEEAEVPELYDRYRARLSSLYEKEKMALESAVRDHPIFASRSG